MKDQDVMTGNEGEAIMQAKLILKTALKRKRDYLLSNDKEDSYSPEYREPTIIGAMRDIVDLHDAMGGTIEETIEHLYSIATPEEEYPMYEIAKLCKVKLPHIPEE